MWAWVWAGWVFGVCEAATHNVLSMCETRPCIRTAPLTTNQPDSESENQNYDVVPTAEGDKKKTAGQRQFYCH